MIFISLYLRMKDWFHGKPQVSWREEMRSSKWPTVRKHHLQKEDRCQWCGGRENLQVHHRFPFHLQPQLELEDSNLITLCEKPGENCHLIHGHNDDWKKFNPHIREDCVEHQRVHPFPKDIQKRSFSLLGWILDKIGYDAGGDANC